MCLRELRRWRVEVGHHGIIEVTADAIADVIDELAKGIEEDIVDLVVVLVIDAGLVVIVVVDLVVVVPNADAAVVTDEMKLWEMRG